MRIDLTLNAQRPTFNCERCLARASYQLETRVQERMRELREKNQQMAEELRMARELQLALLPQQFPTVPAHVAADQSALRFLSLYFPMGDVSGDFFSVFGEKAAGVFICDVMGHGGRSALITSLIRDMFLSRRPMWKTPSCGLPTPAIRVRFTSNKVPRVPRNVRGRDTP
jgi:glutamine synthetase adenylyltransferase